MENDDNTHTSVKRATIYPSTLRESTSNGIDYDEAFELTGHGRFNYIVLCACCVIFMYCSLEMAGLAYVITPAECDLALTVHEKSMINSGIFIGIVATSICWGMASDRFGRRKVMLPTIICTVVASFLSSICNAFWVMFPLRILTGALVSGPTASVLVYLSELHITKKRDFALAFAITSDQINFVVLPGIAYVIIRGTWHYTWGPIGVKPWRVFMWSWGVLGMMGAIVLFFLPESPRFILASDGAMATLPILAKIYACNQKKKPNDYPISIVRTRSTVLHSRHSGIKNIIKDILQLLKPPIRRCYIITHFCMFMTYLIANGLYIWMPAFINNALADVTSDYTICDIITHKYADPSLGYHGFIDPYMNEDCSGQFSAMMYPMSICMEMVYLVPYVLVVWLINKVNVRKLYACLSAMCSLGLVVSCVFPQIVVAVIAMIVGLCTGCLTSILSALAIQAFPTSLRALAMCTMFMMGQIGAIIGVNLIGFMNGITCHIIFACVVSGLMLSAIILLKLWPDLVEVREEMESRNFSY